MQTRFVACTQHFDDRRWRQHRHPWTPRTPQTLDIPVPRPRQQRIVQHQPGALVHFYVRSIWQRIETREKCSFGEWACAAFGLQHAIHCISRGGLVGMHSAPGALEAAVVREAAFRARTVTVGKRRCFVEEKQLGVTVWLQDSATSTPKLQSAGNPATHLPVAHDVPLRAVQDAAIAHQRSPLGDRDDLAKWGDAVSQRHVLSCCPMNEEHLRLCASAEWAATVENEILPWALHGRELGDNVLEVGPGPGLTTAVLSRMVPSLTAVELDTELAAALAERMAGSNVEVVHADATTMPFENARFSTATCFTMLHHVPSPELQDRLMGEVRRVLRPGGVFIGVDSIQSPEWWELHRGDTCVPVDPAGLRARLLRVGFSDAEVELSTPAPPRRFRFAAIC